jgi:hypothetical protein
MAFEGALAGGRRDAAPALTVSGVGSTAIWLQRGLEAIDQGGSGKGLAQEENCSCLQRSGANILLGKRVMKMNGAR